MKNTPWMVSSLVLLISGAALAAPPAWKTGTVREVDNNYARVAINDGRGSPGLKGQGTEKQYCTIEVDRQLVIGERDLHTNFDRSKFFVEEDKGVALKIAGDTMTVKDSEGHERSFHVVKTLPDTPANMPDRTAFSEPPLVM